MAFFKIKSSLNIDLKIYLSRSLKDRLKRLELHRIQTSLDPYILQGRVYAHVRIWFGKAASEAVTFQNAATLKTLWLLRVRFLQGGVYRYLIRILSVSLIFSL